MDGLTGLASGVDTAAIVEKLMGLERQGRTRMDNTSAATSARQTNLGIVQDKLLALRSASAGLRDVGTWSDAQVIESSDTRVTAERISGAGPGGYSVNVLALARSEQRTYDFASPGAATTIDIGSVSIPLAAGATIDDAVNAVNGGTGSPVYASNVNGKLVLSARTTGTNSAFAATSGSLSGEVVRAGQNARYTIDGGAEVPSQTNAVTDAVAGLRLTFKGVTATPASVTIGSPGLDKAKVKTKVEAFITAYNDLVTTTRGMLDEKRATGAASTTGSARGVLFGDTGLSSMLSRLRTATADTIGGNATTMDELRELGVSTGAATGGLSSANSKTGLLELSETTLDKALESPQAVRQMLGGLTGTDGFAQRIEGIVKTYTGANGTITSRIAEGDRSLKLLQDQMTAEDGRLSLRETRLKAQFAAMESAMSNAQTQSAWLTGQLAAL